MYATGLVTGAPDYPEAARWFTTSTLKKQKKVSAAGLYGLGYLQLSGLGLAAPNPEQVGRRGRGVDWGACFRRSLFMGWYGRMRSSYQQASHC
jgi:hypothetical protein